MDDDKEQVKEPILTVEKMEQNVMKTKSEIHKRKLLIARSKLSLKRFRQKGRIVIDVNENLKN